MNKKVSVFVILFGLLCFFLKLDAKTDVFFTPDDNIRKMIIDLIDSCPSGEKIYFIVYMFTDKKVVDALDRAKRRNVDVQVITDSITQNSKYGKTTNLIQSGIDVYIYYPQSQALFPPIMHVKGYYINGKFIGGSFNCTNAASIHNYEMIFLTDEEKICTKFLKYFEKLKTICTCLYKNSTTQQNEGTFLQSLKTVYNQILRCGFYKKRMQHRIR